MHRGFGYCPRVPRNLRGAAREVVGAKVKKPSIVEVKAPVKRGYGAARRNGQCPMSKDQVEAAVGIVTVAKALPASISPLSVAFLLDVADKGRRT